MEKTAALEIAREFIQLHTTPAKDRFQRDEFADMLIEQPVVWKFC